MEETDWGGEDKGEKNPQRLCSVSGCWQFQDKASVVHNSITCIQAPTTQQWRTEALNCIKMCRLRFIEISSSIFQLAHAVQVSPSSPSHRVENEIACLPDANGNRCCVSFNESTQTYSRLKKHNVPRGCYWTSHRNTWPSEHMTRDGHEEMRGETSRPVGSKLHS